MTPLVVLRLIEDVIGAGAPAVTLADSCNRSFYAVEGKATVLDAHGSRALAADRALRFEGPVTVTAGPGGARLWRFEIVPASAADDGRLAGPGLRSAVKLAAETVLPEADGWLMRCDRVDFPPGAVTPKHTHKGPGIRCLLSGAVDAKIGDTRRVYHAGQAWFEAGPDPVVGTPSASAPTAFVRWMVLPRALLGLPSFRYWDEAAKAVPRSQSFRLFFDEPMAP